MNNYKLNGMNVPPEEFLRPFFDLKEKVCLRVFSDKPDSAFSGQKLECILENFSDIVDTLKAHNEQGRGIYFVINYGGHEDESITRINAQFMECDDLPLEEQLAKIQAFPLEPSLIVKTRKSLHCYWLIKNGDVSAFRHIQRKLITHFSSDPACVNESRVFRLPGFFHCKEEPVMVDVIKYNPEIRYLQKELEAVLPDIPDEPEYTSSPAAASSTFKDYGTQKGLVLAGKRCLFLQHCKKDAKALAEPDWYGMITNLAVFEGGADAIHKLSKTYPTYTEKATQAKIDHFHKSGTKPMTCAKIAENGFVCPRLKNNSCTARSPAALSFKPLDLTELKKLLSVAKYAHEPVADIQTARKFINDYMYNFDPGLAEPFIKYEIKQHFSFKNDDLKPLISFHKDIFARFSASREIRRERSSQELPEWYEVNEKGKLRLMPGILANHLAGQFNAFYCAEQYYYYDNGVYTVRADKDARATVRTYR